MPNLEFYFKKSRVIWYILICLGFVIVSAFFISTPETFISTYLFGRNSTLIFIFGIFGLIFFGLGLVVLSMQFFDRRPFLIISSETITQRTLFKLVEIKWSQIKIITPYLWQQSNPGIYGMTKTKQKFLQIITLDNQAHNISTAGLGMNAEKMLAKIKQFYDNLPQNSSSNVEFIV